MPRRYRPTWVVAAALGAVVVAVAAMATDGPFALDRAVARWFAAHGDGGPVSGLLTQLGAGPVVYPLLAVVCAATASPTRRRRSRTYLPVALLAAAQVVEVVVTAPFVRVGPDGGTALASSLSSGHAAAAVVGWGLAASVVARGGARDGARGGARCRRAVALPAAVLAAVVVVVVALTRVALGLHWTSDVLLGVLVGVVLLGLATTVLDRVSGGHPPAPRIRPAPGTRRWLWVVPAAVAVADVVPILAKDPDHRLGDLLVYHGTASAVATGGDLYEFRTVFGLPFTYPPFAALLAEPLARMPLGLVQVGWTAASLAAAVVVTFTVLRPVVDRIGAPLTLAALLLTAPVRSHLSFGQVGLFLVALVGLDLLAARSGRWRGAGVGIASAIKLTPAVLVPWLALVDRPRAWRTVAWAAGSTVLGLLLVWPSAPDYLTRAAFDSGRFGRNDIPGNQSVRGMLLRLDLPDRAVTVGWLLAAVVLLVVGVRQAVRLERHGDRLAAVGVMVAVSVAVSPISWVHHLVWLAFPLAALVAAGRVRLAAGWWAVLVVSFPFLADRGSQALPELDPLWIVLVDLQGLTAVATMFLLPRLIGLGSAGRGAGTVGERGDVVGDPAAQAR